MDPVGWTLVGLTLDLLGAFLVSVAAVRLENVRSLRNTLAQLDNRFRRQIFVTRRARQRSWVRRALANVPYVLIHYVGGATVLLGVLVLMVGVGVGLEPGAASSGAWEWVRAGLPWFLCQWFYWSWPPLPVTLPTLDLVVFLAGEAVHRALRFVLPTLVAGLDQTDRRTPDGTIRMLGFLFLFLGFTAQGIGAWSGRPSRR